ncbi:hypothetical protein RGUI_1937 [Rhodovulum sp. P5]|nr:hypothetical protein RGUI_1937 [Rhodovulum sp. P5]
MAHGTGFRFRRPQGYDGSAPGNRPSRRGNVHFGETVGGYAGVWPVGERDRRWPMQSIGHIPF